MSAAQDITAAQTIAEFAVRTDLRDVPPPVRRAATLHLVDTVGVGLAGSTGTEQQAWSQAISAGGFATCLSGGTAAPSEAAMLNGALIHSLEYDDTHLGSVIHGSAVAAPVALAVAEAEGASGADLLLAYIVAWEVMIRIGLAAPGKFQERGFQVTAIAGAVGAAAAAGRLRGLDGPKIAQAIGIAGSQASGLLAFLENGSSVKALNPGWAAHTGILAASLAKCGMTGPPGIFEGPLGVMRCFAGDAADLAPLLATLGDEWHLPDAAFKLYPCCHYIHPFLEAVEQLMAGGLAAADVETITAHVAPGQAPLICEPWARRQSPASGHDGKWGLAYCIALMLTAGKVEVASFETPPPDVVALAGKIAWTPMRDADFPAVFPARLSVGTVDGARLNVEIATVRGAPGRPVPEAAIQAKFLANAGRRLPVDSCQRLLRTLENLADTPSVSVLAELRQPAAPPNAR